MSVWSAHTHFGVCPQVQALLQAGANVRSKDDAGRTACHLSAALNRYEATLALIDSEQIAYEPHQLELGANDGSTALHHAAFNGAVRPVVALVLEKVKRIQAERKAVHDSTYRRMKLQRQQTGECRSEVGSLREIVRVNMQKDSELREELVRAETDEKDEAQGHEDTVAGVYIKYVSISMCLCVHACVRGRREGRAE